MCYSIAVPKGSLWNGHGPERGIQERNVITDCSTGCHIRNSFSSLGFFLELSFLSWRPCTLFPETKVRKRSLC